MLGRLVLLFLLVGATAAFGNETLNAIQDGSRRDVISSGVFTLILFVVAVGWSRHIFRGR
jgi:hypothetical protein